MTEQAKAPAARRRPELAALWVVSLAGVALGLGVAIAPNSSNTARLVGFVAAGAFGVILQIVLIATAVSLGIRHARD